MKTNFKILIVDDEVLIAEFLKDKLMAMDYTNIALAHSRKQAFELINSFNPNLILLDIRMKNEREGIEIAEELNKNYNIPFIFITAHSDKDIIQHALSTKPSGYITKPFKAIDIYAAVHLVETNIETINESFLLFKDGTANIKLATDTILFAQSDDNYIHVVTSSKKYTLRNTLEWFRENTPSHMFHRTHRSYIVNISKITKSTKKRVFINQIEIPISRGNQPNLGE